MKIFLEEIHHTRTQLTFISKSVYWMLSLPSVTSYELILAWDASFRGDLGITVVWYSDGMTKYDSCLALILSANDIWHLVVSLIDVLLSLFCFETPKICLPTRYSWLVISMEAFYYGNKNLPLS